MKIIKNTTGGFPKELFEDTVTKFVKGTQYVLEPIEMSRGEGWDKDKLIVTYRIKSPSKYKA